jgi:uncharacterized alpha/beta hydrolase family protein
MVYEGFIDAGTLVISALSEERGLWGKMDAPFMVTSSYFFDIYKNADGIFATTSSKEDSIDTYALRLKDIIDQVKYKTDKNKVIIIAHSMGGVVTRRYIEIFEQESIDKLIFATVPNKGVDSKITGMCGILGSDIVCKDLDENSLFMNKLNNVAADNPETHNIIGMGCDMEGETGDGIVKNSSQYLDYATNYYISGDCDEYSFRYLHQQIGNAAKYPEVFNIIKKVLKED